MLGIIFFIVQITGKADSLCQSVDASVLMSFEYYL